MLKHFLGTPYEWGATGPNTFDCSGFVQYVYAHFGVSTGRSTYDQITHGEFVSTRKFTTRRFGVFWNRNSSPRWYLCGK